MATKNHFINSLTKNETTLYGPRLYRKEELTHFKRVNLLCGSDGVGKTMLLEAVKRKLLLREYPIVTLCQNSVDSLSAEDYLKLIGVSNRGNVHKKFGYNLQKIANNGKFPYELHVTAEHILRREINGGVKKIFSLLAGFNLAKGGFLLIDDLDEYSSEKNYPKLSDIILEYSESSNCQVFFTTSSLLLSKSFGLAVSKRAEKSVSATIIAENKNSEIVFMTLGANGLVSSTVTHDFTLF